MSTGSTAAVVSTMAYKFNFSSWVANNRRVNDFIVDSSLNSDTIPKTRFIADESEC